MSEKEKGWTLFPGGSELMVRLLGRIGEGVNRSVASAWLACANHSCGYEKTERP